MDAGILLISGVGIVGASSTTLDPQAASSPNNKIPGSVVRIDLFNLVYPATSLPMIPISERLQVAEFHDEAANSLLIDCRAARPPDQYAYGPIVVAIAAVVPALMRFVRAEREYAHPNSVAPQTRERPL